MRQEEEPKYDHIIMNILYPNPRSGFKVAIKNIWKILQEEEKIKRLENE